VRAIAWFAALVLAAPAWAQEDLPPPPLLADEESPPAPAPEAEPPLPVEEDPSAEAHSRRLARAYAEELPAQAPPPPTDKNRQLDLTAEVLQPGEGQFNLFYLQYSRGILPGLQLSAHFGGYLLTLVNLTGEYQFLDRPELRASLEAGTYWFALSQLVQATALQIHLTPRATVPLGGDFELNLAATVRAQVLALPGVSQNVRDLRSELTLIRYDGSGAWMLQGRFPILTHQSMQATQVLGQASVTGSLLLDDVDAWGVVLFRDQVMGDTTHLRFGLGYRNRPGLILADSLGNVILQFDLYWR